MSFSVSGFKFSRASYLLSLLRPQIYSDLELKVELSCLWPDSVGRGGGSSSSLPWGERSLLLRVCLWSLFRPRVHLSRAVSLVHSHTWVLPSPPSCLKNWEISHKNWISFDGQALSSSGPYSYMQRDLIPYMGRGSRRCPITSRCPAWPWQRSRLNPYASEFTKLP